MTKIISTHPREICSAHTNMSAKTIAFKPPSSVKAVGGHSYGGALSFNTNNRKARTLRRRTRHLQLT